MNYVIPKYLIEISSDVLSNYFNNSIPGNVSPETLSLALFGIKKYSNFYKRYYPKLFFQAQFNLTIFKGVNNVK